MNKPTREQEELINRAIFHASTRGDVKEAVNMLPHGLHCYYFVIACVLIGALAEAYKTNPLRPCVTFN